MYFSEHGMICHNCNIEIDEKDRKHSEEFQKDKSCTTHKKLGTGALIMGCSSVFWGWYYWDDDSSKYEDCDDEPDEDDLSPFSPSTIYNSNKKKRNFYIETLIHPTKSAPNHPQNQKKTALQ